MRLSSIISVLLALIILPAVPAAGEDEITVNIDSIIRLTYEQNPEVAAARYSLEAAEYQFKDFERELNQFTPLLLSSNIDRDERDSDRDHSYRVKAGMEKEFFNGSSAFAGVGHRGDFGDGEESNINYIEMDLQFPVFGSNTTLRRITQRSREENERLNASLEYADEIRYEIQGAQERYFWFQVVKERARITREWSADLRTLLSLPGLKENASDRSRVEDEIQSMQSDVIYYNNHVDTYLLTLQYAIGLDELPHEKVEETDLYESDYYGKSYLSRSLDDLLKEADRNDVKIKVLSNARQNSIEKRKLAEKGKWDIFVDLTGQYDLEGTGGLRDDDGYYVGAGVRIRSIDSKLLGYSMKRAEAEIKKYDARIRGRKQETRQSIEQDWVNARSRRSQIEELMNSVKSRRRVYNEKKEAYRQGKDTIDNVIQARRDLRDTEFDLVNNLGEFYENITELDSACGVSLSILGIKVSSEGF